MSLAAAQVVDALVARLATATGQPVITDRANPLAEAALPAWRVLIDAEDTELVDLSRVHRHQARIALRGSTRALPNLDDALNTMASAASAALFADPVPHDLRLDGIRREMAGDGEAAVGRITLFVTATFYVNPAAPEALL